MHTPGHAVRRAETLLGPCNLLGRSIPRPTAASEAARCRAAVPRGRLHRTSTPAQPEAPPPFRRQGPRPPGTYGVGPAGRARVYTWLGGRQDFRPPGPKTPPRGWGSSPPPPLKGESPERTGLEEGTPPARSAPGPRPSPRRPSPRRPGSRPAAGRPGRVCGGRAVPSAPLAPARLRRLRAARVPTDLRSPKSAPTHVRLRAADVLALCCACVCAERGRASGRGPASGAGPGVGGGALAWAVGLVLAGGCSAQRVGLRYRTNPAFHCPP